MSADVDVLLQTVWDLTVDQEAWPTFRRLDQHLWSEHEADAIELIAAAGPALVHGGQGLGDAEPHPDNEVSLTLMGLTRCEGAGPVLDAVFRALRAALQADKTVTDSSEPYIKANDAIEGASDGNARATSSEASRLARLTGIVLVKEPWHGYVTLHQDGWRLTVDRRVRRYRHAADMSAYVAMRAEELRQSLGPATEDDSRTPQLGLATMKPERAIKELRKLQAEATTTPVRQSGAPHEAWKAKTDAVLAAALGSDSQILKGFRAVRYWIGISTGAPGEQEENARYFAERVDDAAAQIDAAVYSLELQLPDTEETERPALDLNGPIFIIHGRDDARRNELARTLERVTGRDVKILHEQASRGETVIEKLERHAATASFAVALLTGDDRGGLNSDGQPLTPRARQNVILELGLFIGLLGRGHVAVLLDEGVEQPSDLHGLVYIPLDDRGGWRLPLLKELEDAGLPVDRNRLP